MPCYSGEVCPLRVKGAELICVGFNKNLPLCVNSIQLLPTQTRNFDLGSMLPHGMSGTWIIHNDIFIIHGGTRKITVCSSTFDGENSKFCCRYTKNYIYIKITGMNSNFYILHHEKVLCSIFDHISPLHEFQLVVLVGN